MDLMTNLVAQNMNSVLTKEELGVLIGMALIMLAAVLVLMASQKSYSWTNLRRTQLMTPKYSL